MTKAVYFVIEGDYEALSMPFGSKQRAQERCDASNQMSNGFDGEEDSFRVAKFVEVEDDDEG